MNKIGNLYIGLENELMVFDKKGGYEPNDIYEIVRFLIRKKGTGESIENRASILKTGNAIYEDSGVIELLTPPIRINKGFASRLADSIDIARRILIDQCQKFSFTGYSMHWNLSGKGEDRFNGYWGGIAVPFLALGLNPLSCAANFCLKSGYTRIQIAGESLQGYEQIAATALLLGAYHLARRLGDRAPFELLLHDQTKIIRDDNDWSRDTIFQIYDDKLRDSHEEDVNIQKVLEAVYHWLKPYIKALGTKDDSRYLKEFVEGSRKLEIDMQKYFSSIRKSGGFKAGVYYPSSEHILRRSKRRAVPLENLLTKALAEVPSIEYYNWSEFESEDKKLKGIDNMYSYAIGLLEKEGKACILEQTPRKVPHSVLPKRYRKKIIDVLGELK